MSQRTEWTLNEQPISEAVEVASWIEPGEAVDFDVEYSGGRVTALAWADGVDRSDLAGIMGWLVRNRDRNASADVDLTIRAEDGPQRYHASVWANGNIVLRPMGWRP